MKNKNNNSYYLRFTGIKMAYKEYKVVHIAEGGCGTIFLGSSGLP